MVVVKLGPGVGDVAALAALAVARSAITEVPPTPSREVPG
jgi:hypothetical protein